MSIEQKSVVITSAVRTAIGTFRGSLKNMQGHELGSVVIKESIKRSNLKLNDVDELIIGQVLTGATGQNPARQAAILAGLPIEKTAYVINQVCGSGLRSVAAGYQAIVSNDSNVVIAGGQESMSNAPKAINIHGGQKLEEENLIDTMIKDGLWDAFNGYHMGVTAENVASKWKITREDQDDFALLSQTKVEKAQKEGKFKNEIVPINGCSKDGGIRPATNQEILDGLKLAFNENGTVTAGTSSPLTDGAAATLICDEEYAKENKLDILARIVSTAVQGCSPEVMGLGPIGASEKALNRASLTIKDIDIIELNEAFASQSLACIKDLNIEEKKVNLDGGAIALGHPLGATGARITGKAAELLRRENKKYALSTQCIGLGQGIATVLETVN